MELTTLIQFICIQKRRLGLSLTNGSEAGYILFDNGDVVHAETEGIEGEDAIIRLLDWDDGNFSTFDETEIKRRTINMSWDKLLMEAVVKLDEAESFDFDDDLAFGDDEKKELTEEENTQDSILEDRMMLLLSQLEQEQTQIKFGKVKGAEAVLGSLVDMANSVLDCFDKAVIRRRDGVKLHKDCTKYISRYPVARWLLTPDGKLSNKSAQELYKQADSAQSQQVFADTCLSIIGVMDSAFKVLIACFHSRESANDMDEAYNLFLRDLNDTVGNLTTQ